MCIRRRARSNNSENPAWTRLTRGPNRESDQMMGTSYLISLTPREIMSQEFQSIFADSLEGGNRLVIAFSLAPRAVDIVFNVLHTYVLAGRRDEHRVFCIRVVKRSDQSPGRFNCRCFLDVPPRSHPHHALNNARLSPRTPCTSSSDASRAPSSRDQTGRGTTTVRSSAARIVVRTLLTRGE